MELVALVPLREPGGAVGGLPHERRCGNLRLPSLGLVMPVRMQLLIGDATGTTCWDSSFASAARNDPTTFKANGS